MRLQTSSRLKNAILKKGCFFKGGCPYPSQDMKFPSHSTSATMMDASGGASTSSACSSQPPKGIGKIGFVYRDLVQSMIIWRPD